MKKENELAILRLEMTEDIPAYILGEIVGLLDEMYFMHLYLDRAAESERIFPDEYAPTEIETLYVNRLEIGSPNFVELVGMAEPLIEVFKWLGGFAGIGLAAKQTLELVKTYYEIKELRLNIRKSEMEHAKAKKEERIEQYEIDTTEETADPYLRSLRVQEKLSKSALGHKKEVSDSAKTRAGVIRPFVYSPTIVVFQATEAKKG